MLKAIKLENSIDYRFALVEEEALNCGIEQEIESVIKTMLQKNMDIQDIRDITGKSIEEIKKIENDLNKNNSIFFLGF